MATRFLRANGALVALAILAFCIVIVRACLQSITLDEAGTVLGLALKPWPTQWWPASDNHVLNTMLERLAFAVFGVSNLTARLPAILGALVYITSAIYLVAALTTRTALRAVFFICLVYNPLILDYLVAARGYSLAIGFFLAAIAVIASSTLRNDDPRLRTHLAWVSALLALSCAANFSFSIAAFIALITYAAWAAWPYRAYTKELASLAACTFVPGLVIGFVLCGSVLPVFPKRELYFGSKKLSEMWSGFASGSFDALNPNIVNPLLMSWLKPIGKLIPHVALAGGLSLLAWSEIIGWKNRTGEPGQVSGLTRNFVRAIFSISLAALLLHWLAFRILQIPLPKDRTGLFFLPLWTLTICGSLAAILQTKIGRLVPRLGIMMLTLIAAYFVGCLRLDYFKEWKFDSDTKQLYWILNDLHHRCGIDKFGIDWRYHLPLNFYREVYRNYELKEFSMLTSAELPVDRDAYAVFFPTSGEFLRQQALRVIYHNEDSDAAVAVRSCPAAAK
ncbi:MAG TPA: hypothetical protein VEV37_08310 [Bryobacteraceae bacterium]|nr:hypothetical protein [Bryobacteraceae bacterium]